MSQLASRPRRTRHANEVARALSFAAYTLIQGIIRTTTRSTGTRLSDHRGALQ